MPIRFHPPPLSSSNLVDTDDRGPTKWLDLGDRHGAAPVPTPLPRHGDAITFIPPASSASKKPKPGVRVLSAHPDYAIGLGLVRLEMVEKVYGLPAFGQTDMDRVRDDGGRLIWGDAKLGDETADRWRVWAGRGRGWYTPEEEKTVS